ncbi:ABC transporter permease [Salisediminibacterium halotolerans]|uniref:ABC transport system permease protein n=1 Tax=Salisediminibacterium halotolerans TaxID=517425 RepID=A0A1H9SWQ9_9BACI|nr:ABC transporter permease [Salisediminibacterium haloalkalitolerans]SER89351.1 putative ABC transport system permease protein [Salisediminibacterium haloalkalitolerans]
MLLKNVRRTLSKKWMQLSAISLIIFLSSFIYTALFYGISGIEEPTETYLADYNQEDFAVEMMNRLTEREWLEFSGEDLEGVGLVTLEDVKEEDPDLFMEIIHERKEAFKEENSGVELELREMKTLYFDASNGEHEALALKDAASINRSFIEDGQKPAADDEVALTQIYAEKNGLAIGDDVFLHGDRYTISGFVLFPDYTLPMFDESFALDAGKQTLFLFTDNAYEDLSENESFRLAGTWTDEEGELTAEEEGTAFVTHLIDTKSNMRSGAVYDELSGSKAAGLGLSLFISLIAVIIVAMLMQNLLQAERGQIGILKALGYRRVNVALPYLLALLPLAFGMLVLGYAAGYAAAEPMKNVYLDFYLLPETPIGQRLDVFLLAIFAPFAVFTFVSGWIIYRILGERPLALLNPKETDSVNALTRVVSKCLTRAKGAVKFKYLHAVRSTGSFVIFFLGIMFATILILFAFMMNGMMERMTTEYLEKMAYEYEAYPEEPLELDELPPETEPFLVYPYAQYEEETVILQGVEADNDLHHLYNEEDENITREINDGAVLSETMRMKFDIEIGDTVDLKVNQQEIEAEVRGFTAEYLTDKVYFDLEELSLIVSDGESTELYSGVYSLSALPEDDFATVISKQGMIDQNESLEGYLDVMTTILIAGSSIIAASIMFILTSFTVEKNFYAISLLKVLGYSRREVNGMILNSYFVYMLLSYVLSIPIALAALHFLVVFMAGYGVVLPLELEPVSLIFTLMILVVIFFISTEISRRKIQRIPLQEVLKRYYE